MVLRSGTIILLTASYDLNQEDYIPVFRQGWYVLKESNTKIFTARNLLTSSRFFHLVDLEKEEGGYKILACYGALQEELSGSEKPLRTSLSGLTRESYIRTVAGYEDSIRIENEGVLTRDSGSPKDSGSVRSRSR